MLELILMKFKSFTIRSVIAFFMFLVSSCLLLAGEKYYLTHEQWAVPKQAEVVLNMPAIAKVFAALQAFPEGQLLVRYPGGDEGTLWAHELRSWLVSLGISMKNIELRPGSMDGAVIELLVLEDQTGIAKPGTITLNKTSGH